ncbi:hypothetical protein ABEF93_004500 [Exophiala dermatitidis]
MHARRHPLAIHKISVSTEWSTSNESRELNPSNSRPPQDRTSSAVSVLSKMAPPTQTAGQKRKVAFDKAGQTFAARKRQKNQDARNIPVQPAAATLSAQGELNVASFIKAREYEISALERSMQKARKVLTTRAFQQVPRHMRRRTASHNAKKVPRRLRRKAEREMQEDNTPTVTKRTRTPSRKLRLRLETAKAVRKMNQKTKTVRQRKREAKANAKQTDPEDHVSISRVPRLKKNTLAEPPKATSKYKRRQVNKTWLPTHLWHTKRAHMTRPTEPLWRMAIPLSPTEKSYRPSHRAAGSRGCIAWDTSYLSTVACRGTEHTLDNLLASLGFLPQGLSTSLLKKWKAGTRFAEGWVYERDGTKRPIAPITVIWCIQPKDKPATVRDSQSADADKMDVDPKATEASSGPPQPQRKQKTKLDHQLLIRIHPSAFHQFWQELLKVAKLQKPQVLVEDLRFEVGSLQIQGPGSTEALMGVLRPYSLAAGSEDAIGNLWTSLAGLNNPAVLPQNAMLWFDIVDPRLSHPPKRIQVDQGPDRTARLNEILVSWPADRELSYARLTSHKERWLVSHSLPSQKAINRWRALAPPGQPPALTAKDPRIPMMLLASRSDDHAATNGGNSQGKWTVLLPWSCVDPVWRSLMYYSLTGGGTPRFGGLHETQQLAFEHKTPWFPGDFPGTEAGKAWERTQSENRFDEWIRRPPKHRVALDKLDLGLGRVGELGRGWACDWEFLLTPKHKEDAGGVLAGTTNGAAPPATKTTKPPLTQRQRKAAKAKAKAETEQAARRRNTSSPESDDEAQPLPAIPEIEYTQLPPSTTLSLLKNPKPAMATLPSTPALMTVRITLLDKGTPAPAARIYRLPTLPKVSKTAPDAAAAAPSSGEKTAAEAETETETASTQTQPQSWSSAPPPAQRPPSTSTTDSSSDSTTSALNLNLRDRWLAMDLQHVQKTTTTGNLSRLQKQKTNKFNLPRQQHAYPRESLAHINVLPPNAPPEIVAKYGPDSAFGRGDGGEIEIPKERQKPAQQQPAAGQQKDQWRQAKTTNEKSKGRAEAATDDQQVRHAEAHMKSSLDLAAVATATAADDLLVFPLDSPSEWAKHPPCPDVDDLIGFVTSGGYNLAEGRGTAVGAIWAQKVVEGWLLDDEDGTTTVVTTTTEPGVATATGVHVGTRSRGGGGGDAGGSGNARKSNTSQQQKHANTNDVLRLRQRRGRLCIVRNAGERIGRLGIWECCA